MIRKVIKAFKDALSEFTKPKPLEKEFKGELERRKELNRLKTIDRAAFAVTRMLEMQGLEIEKEDALEIGRHFFDIAVEKGDVDEFNNIKEL